MPAPYPELTGALGQFLDRLDAVIRGSGYEGAPILMYLAGGLAVNYYCGTRYTGDIDASFSHRILLQDEELAFTYLKRDGSRALLYFDRNYNPLFGLLHEAYEADSVEWAGIGNERRKVQLRVLSPVDLAVSKIARFSDQDLRDILDVARTSGLTFAAVETRSLSAMADYVGNREPVLANLRVLRTWMEAEGMLLSDA
jgi:hypothetical protein